MYNEENEENEAEAEGFETYLAYGLMAFIIACVVITLAPIIVFVAITGFCVYFITKDIQAGAPIFKEMVKSFRNDEE